MLNLLDRFVHTSPPYYPWDIVRMISCIRVRYECGFDYMLVSSKDDAYSNSFNKQDRYEFFLVSVTFFCKDTTFFGVEICLSDSCPNKDRPALLPTVMNIIMHTGVNFQEDYN